MSDQTTRPVPPPEPTAGLSVADRLTAARAARWAAGDLPGLVHRDGVRASFQVGGQPVAFRERQPPAQEVGEGPGVGARGGWHWPGAGPRCGFVAVTRVYAAAAGDSTGKRKNRAG